MSTLGKDIQVGKIYSNDHTGKTKLCLKTERSDEEKVKIFWLDLLYSIEGCQKQNLSYASFYYNECPYNLKELGSD